MKHQIIYTNGLKEVAKTLRPVKSFLVG